MNLPGLLLVISGPSATGKGTVCRALLDQNPNIVYSVSATTRLPRDGEVDGVNYYFIDQQRFQQIIDEDGFIEWAKVYSGKYYGTPKKPVFDSLAAGKDVILEIDIQGAMQVKKKFPWAVFVFILPPSLKELRNRIIHRGTESAEAMSERLNCAETEIRSYCDYDYIVLNDKVKEAVSTIQAIIKAEKQKACRFKCVDKFDHEKDEFFLIPERY